MTKQSNSITAANDVIAFANTLQVILRQAQELSARITSQGYVGVWESLPTAPWNADGTLGAADATPVNTNPITTSDLDIPANDLIGVVYDVNDFVVFMTNTVSGNNPAAKNRLADLEKVIV